MNKNKNVGKIVTFLREYYQKSLEELANIMGFSESTMIRIEKGNRAIDFDEIEFLCSYFDVGVSVFFDAARHNRVSIVRPSGEREREREGLSKDQLVEKKSKSIDLLYNKETISFHFGEFGVCRFLDLGDSVEFCFAKKNLIPYPF